MSFYIPVPSKDVLCEQFRGQSILDVPTPAAVIDVACVRNNCEQMLHACDVLDLEWRAHVKTHKVCLLCYFMLHQLSDILIFPHFPFSSVFRPLLDVPLLGTQTSSYSSNLFDRPICQADLQFSRLSSSLACKWVTRATSPRD
jgi:hypothetical protein